MNYRVNKILVNERIIRGGVKPPYREQDQFWPNAA